MELPKATSCPFCGVNIELPSWRWDATAGILHWALPDVDCVGCGSSARIIRGVIAGNKGEYIRVWLEYEWSPPR